MDLCGKNVVYVGGFGGIGFASCKKLILKNIASLTILDIMEKPDLLKELKSLNQSARVFYIKVDLCVKESIKQSLKSIIDTIKYIDVLVNGSGVVNEHNVELAITINLTGLINMTLEAIPCMDKSLDGRGGVIMNISSLAGLKPFFSNAVYSATKYGVVGFTRSISADYYYERTGIMMMTFCPGYTDTPLALQFDKVNVTFPYSVRHLFGSIQTADECGITLVKAIECGKNGTVWKSNAGDLQEVKMFDYCE